MITEKTLQELAGYEPTDTPVVSLYLNVDPTRRTTEAYKLRLRGLIKDAGRADLAQDFQAMERYFEHEYDWRGRGVALFSNQRAGLWRTYPLAVPVSRSLLEIGPKPFIRPLVSLYDKYGSFGVALVDRQGARLFDFNMGELIETDGVLGEEVRRIKRGGGSSRPGTSRSGGRGGSQREREVANQNLREAAEATSDFFEQKGFRHLLIAGTDENVSQFQELLPRHLQDEVVGTFSADMNAKEGDILERSLEIVQQADREHEAELVEKAITGAAKGTNGVIRLDDTLGAVSEGRVQYLLVSDGFRAPGFRCKSCTYLTAQQLSACPFCGGKIQRIDDAVELAIQRVTEQGGSIEVIEDSDALDQAGGIAAVLRY
jgi:peptide chain release factor subunit 1